MTVPSSNVRAIALAAIGPLRRARQETVGDELDRDDRWPAGSVFANEPMAPLSNRSTAAVRRRRRPRRRGPGVRVDAPPTTSPRRRASARVVEVVACSMTWPPPGRPAPPARRRRRRRATGRRPGGRRGGEPVRGPRPGCPVPGGGSRRATTSRARSIAAGADRAVAIVGGERLLGQERESPRGEQLTDRDGTVGGTST